MINLAHPALLAIGGLLLLPYLLRPQRAWQYSSLQLLPVSKRVGFSFLLMIGVTCGALTLLLIALARPQQTITHRQQSVDARDIVLTLDLSLSMEGYLFSNDAELRQLRKLDLMQRAARTFVKRHKSDRLGLVVFGDEAFGVWPLSTDSRTLERRLQQLDTLIPTQLRGTRIETALVKSLDHLQELGQATTKMVVLFTDGLDTIEAGEADRLVQRLQKGNIKLYLLGIQLNDQSSIVSLTHRAQGRYFEVNKAEELESALQDIEQLEKSSVREAQDTEIEELYRRFALLGLVLLLAATVCKSVWVLEV
jgi:Ca-activated chloride channel family protein